MRTWLVSFSALTALTAMAGAIASGCSSDNTTPGSGDSGMDGTTADTGAADHAADAPVDAPKEAAAPCVDAAVNVATFNSMSPLWACLQAACVAELGTCAADCTCNTAVFGALLCAADGGDQMTCFLPALTVAGSPLQTCLLNNVTGCSGGGDGGPDGAREGGAEGGRDGGAEGAAEGGGEAGPDGGATDAPASG
jgi:hypothetical protein